MADAHLALQGAYQRARGSSLPGLTWLAPAIHLFRKKMDARVNGIPADHVGGCPSRA
jgi:hypothetical protein